ncbi:DNAse I-like superfamily protein, partial [Striga hermonthica]
EVKGALFSLPPDNSPGEDGMTARFYQHFWDLIKPDLMSAVTSFFHSGMILKYWNHTVVSLIPKCDNPDTLNHYRPISLCILMNILEQYRLFTGQTVNLQKSAIFFSKNTPQNIQTAICGAMNGITSHRSTKYLGLPLGIGKSKKE